MSYLTLAVPAALHAVANLVAIGFEPDYNSPTIYDAFGTLAVDAGGAEWRVYGAPVEPSLAASAALWQYAPDQLHAAVVARLAERFPEVAPLSLEEVTQFTGAVMISTVYGTLAGLGELGLTISEQVHA